MALGIFFVCYSIDAWALEEGDYKFYTAFYYRKTVAPPAWFKYTTVGLFILGILAHVKLLVQIIRSNDPVKYKYADAATIVAFLLNLFVGIKGASIETAIGRFHPLVKPEPSLYDLNQSVLNYHFASLAILASLVVIHFIGLRIKSPAKQKVE
eukprot:TRINITY_DN4038_c0_g1_i2.p1 TRINITY_DN4038_c0_g1~~TRINITY_DN4038_c0_g1_i2.p1  ORF type:complete len:153 (-),score=11.19 TRINITY_DN4038_c0_g1_i2:8-466(-)